MISTVHAVIEVWALARRRWNPSRPAMKTKQGNKRRFFFFFLLWNLFLMGNSNLSNKKIPSRVWNFFLLWNFQSFFSFPPTISFFALTGVSIFLWERETLSFGGLLVTILKHRLTVLRGTDLHLYSICSARSSFYFPVSRALLCLSSIIANTPFLLHSDSKPKHVEELEYANVFMLWGFDQWW